MKQITYLLALIVLLTACKKSDNASNPIDQLPPATHTGANTFGCLINGEPFSVSGKFYRGASTGVTAIPYTNTAWYIDGQLEHRSVTLHFDFNSNPLVPGTFTMAGHYPYWGFYFNYPNGTMPSGSTDYHTDSTHTGTVTVTHYTKTSAAGIFAFDAINGDGDVVHITDGRFDIQFE